MPYRILIIGDYWSRDEVSRGRSFSGGMRPLLNNLLAHGNIPQAECYFTDVFQEYPESSRVQNFCGPKAEGIPGLPPLFTSLYVRAEHAHHFDRLEREINKIRPNLILALGGAATLAITRQKLTLKTTRGSILLTNYSHTDGTPIKAIATYHPREIQRDWSLRPVVIADFTKAGEQMATPIYHRPIRQIWTAPTIDDLHEYAAKYFHADWTVPTGVDIETSHGTITEIGFAPAIDSALVVPFYSRAQPDGNYWRSAREERQAWDWVYCTLQNLRTPIYQNGLYDLNYQWKTMGLTVPHAGEDTMLMAHALQPELLKGLGFLGSIYSDEPYWKNMRKVDTLKKEDQ